MFELIIVIALGFIMGWSLAKLFEKRGKKDRVIDELKKSCSIKKHQLSKVIDESIMNRHLLLKESNLLRKKSDELYRVQERFIVNSSTFENDINNEEEHIKISKDQFYEIEKSLKKYKNIAEQIDSMQKKTEQEKEFEKKVKNSFFNRKHLLTASIFNL